MHLKTFAPLCFGEKLDTISSEWYICSDIPNFEVKQSSPITGLDRPRGFPEVKVPRFRNNGTG